MRPAVLLPLAASILAAQAPTPLEAPIQRVRLHPDEAWVTRVGETHVKTAGTVKLLLKDLPPGLGLDDLRVSAKGPEGSRLGDLAVSSEARTVTETAEYKALLKEQEALLDRQDQLAAEEEAISAEQTFLKNLQASYDKELSARLTTVAPNPAQILELSKGLQQRLAEILGRERRRQREQEKLLRELRRLEAELAKQGAGQRTAPSRVTVELTTLRGGNITVELSYRSRAARWMPAYEARLSGDRKHLELALFAAVVQRSGEDWRDVKLEISNARASRSLALPRYNGALEAGWLAAPPPRRLAMPSPSAGGLMDASRQNTYLPESEPPKEASEGNAQVLEEAQGLAALFTLDGPKEVPSDGEPHRFRVLAKDIQDLGLALVAAPRLDPTAYQVARFPTPSGIPLFPGAPLVQYAGTQRLGQTQLQVPPAGRPFELGFGPYRGLRVAYVRVEARKEQVGAFTKERQWTLRERLEASNDTGEPLELELSDRALRSTVEQVKISSSPDTTPSEEKVPGVRSWTLKVAPKGTATVQLGTLIRAPQEGVLTGLEGLNLPQ